MENRVRTGGGTIAPEAKERLLREIVKNDFKRLSPFDVELRLQAARETPQTAVVAAGITTSDLRRKSREIEKITERLKLVGEYADRICGLAREIEFNSFDLREDGGSEFRRACRTIRKSTLRIRRVLIEQKEKT